MFATCLRKGYLLRSRIDNYLAMSGAMFIIPLIFLLPLPSYRVP